MTLPAHLLGIEFLEANFVVMYHEKLAREQLGALQQLVELPELQDVENVRILAQLTARLNAVSAFVSSMEEPWKKEKLRKQAKLL